MSTTDITRNHPVLTPLSSIRLPQHYASMMSTNQKIDIAQATVGYVRSLGLTPVAASVTGSRLRGTDTTTSDTDIMVLVEEKTRARTIRPRTLAGVADVEGQIQSLDAYLRLLPTSVPYMEFLRSPFIVTAPAYLPLLTAVRPNWNTLSVHAERFVRSVYSRRAVSADKRLRTAAAVHHLLHTGSPLCPRELMAAAQIPATTQQWIAEVLKESEPTHV